MIAGTSMSASPDRHSEDNLLNTLLITWPRGRSDIALDVNAVLLGERIGLDDHTVRRAVQSLVKKGMLHARELQGVLLIHPTSAALACQRAAPKSGLGLL